MRPGTIWVRILFCGAAVSATVSAADSNSNADREVRPDIRVDARLVVVPVSVLDDLDRPRMGLRSENFAVFEDGREQHVNYFSVEDTPASVAILLDSSSSMTGRMDCARAAISAFLTTGNQNDEYFFLHFNRNVYPAGFTHDPAAVEADAAAVQTGGRTSLIDAVYVALNKMRRASVPRRALLLISDGADNSSVYTEVELKDFVRERGVPVFAIGIFSEEELRATGRKGRGPQLLRALTDESGGMFTPVSDTDALAEVAAKLALAIRYQYVLGYAPANRVNDGRYRRIDVRLKTGQEASPLRAFWRKGYYAPAQLVSSAQH